MKRRGSARAAAGDRVSRLLTAATEARAERVERDAAGEDDGVEDEVEGSTSSGLSL